MYKIFFIALTTFGFCACKQIPVRERTEIQEVLPSIESNYETPSDQNTWKIYLQGMWINDEYLNEVAAKQSIYAVADDETLIWGFQFVETENQKINLAGFTKHEGGLDFELNYIPAKNRFESQNSDLLNGDSFSLNDIDSLNLELVFNNTGIRKRYRKVIDDQTALREILFAGSYTSNKTGQTIRLDKSGKVSGCNKDENYFELVYDFGLGFEYDVIQFFKNPKGGNWNDAVSSYHYKINGTKIELYPITCNWENLEHRIGNLNDTWVRNTK